MVLTISHIFLKIEVQVVYNVKIRRPNSDDVDESEYVFSSCYYSYI